MRRKTSRRSSAGPAHLTGFTLVEMLVAVALVMLLMTLFAQVFQMAGGSVSTQRGLMENDQRARTAQTLILGDLSKRTFRKAIPFAFGEIPFAFGEDVTAVEAELSHRRGYLYISENDPFNDTDDVLALTVDAAITRESPDVLNFYGRALALAPDTLTPNQQLLYYRLNLNQPETDDGRLDFNESAESQAAEVAYFLRNGNLYRRVLLIRQQTNDSENDQPKDNNGQRFFSQSFVPPAGPPATPYPGGFAGTSNFWRDFDFSAHPTFTEIPPSSGNWFYDGAEFNGFLTALQIPTPLPSLPALPDAIAYPPNRFGFNTVNPTPLSGSPAARPFGGQPREFNDRNPSASNRWWVGRLTMEESSHVNWTYPQLTHQIPTGVNDASNPMNAAVAWTDSNNDSVIDDLTGGPRRGEDLLLSNVHSFDVKVWDDVLKGFVDVGHSLPAVSGIIGDYHISNRLNPLFGPSAATMSNSSNRTFDTWYPFQTDQQLDLSQDGVISTEDTDGNGVLDVSNDTDVNGNGTLLDHENGPPFRPRKFWAADSTEAGSGRLRLPRWSANQSFAVGDRVFPRLQTDQPGDPFYYVCIQAVDIDGDGDTNSAATAPAWPRIAGLNALDGTPSGELVWQAVDNRKPLRAIQITLRFLDPSTQQMRTLTIQHSLME